MFGFCCMFAMNGSFGSSGEVSREGTKVPWAVQPANRVEPAFAKLRPTARSSEQDRLERSCKLCGAHCSSSLGGNFPSWAVCAASRYGLFGPLVRGK
jgi:hypothetical protein